MQLNINSSAVVAHTNRLERLRISVLPNAIRNTLNNAAYDVKTNTMPESAKNNFVNRSPNFFKVTSKFDKATGNNINSMRSTVGFITGKVKNDFSVKDLEQQENSGTIKKRSFIPLKSARTGNSNNRLIRSNARLSGIDNIVNARNQKGNTKAARFVNAILKAGDGGFVLGSNNNGENILWKVNSIKSNLKSKRFKPRLTPLYDYSPKRSVHVKATNFMKDASLKTGEKLEQMFNKEVERQIAKLK